MIPHRRRGACPSLIAPMQTGDGLLARITPSGSTIPLDAAAKLCAAARAHGNGIIEITARGSIQARGLTEASAIAFADDVEATGIAAADGAPVVANPLAGLEPDEAIDAGALAAALREEIAAAGLRGKLAPKTSVVVDGGGALHLDALPADVRLRAERGEAGARVHVLLGGDAAAAVAVGAVAPEHAVEAAIRLLAVLADRGSKARARDLVKAEGAGAFRSAIGELLLCSDGLSATTSLGSPEVSVVLAPSRLAALGALPRLRGREGEGVAASEKRESFDTTTLESLLGRPRAKPIGLHGLRDSAYALGVGLAYGQSDADALDRLLDAARRAGAAGIRTAPDRALLIVGVERDSVGALAAVAEELGFITRADDPRRSIATCPGAPLCASTEFATRALAPALADAASALLDSSLVLHLSGCAKGCAHPGPAALTIVGENGRCSMILDGAPRDQSFATTTAAGALARLARLAQACDAERRPAESAAAVLSRLGPARVAAILAGPCHD